MPQLLFSRRELRSKPAVDGVQFALSDAALYASETHAQSVAFCSPYVRDPLLPALRGALRCPFLRVLALP